LQVPLAAIIEQGKNHYCLVREQEGWTPRPVTIGSNNNDQVIVLTGLSQGDRVSMTPFQHIERGDLPDQETSSEDEVASDPRSDEHASKPAVSATVPAS
ncbi:MAG: hypothetical protein N2C14_19330, partial [Planctomycetales bacterium]